MNAFLALLAAAPTVGIGIEEASHVSIETAGQLGQVMARAIERRADVEAVLEEQVWTACKDRSCVQELRARSGASEVVLLRIFGAITKIRVVAERFSSGDLPALRGEVDLPLASESWSEPLAGLAAVLFPTAITFEEKQAKVEISPSRGSNAAPIALLVAGVALVGGGTTFAILAATAESDPETALTLKSAHERREFDGIAAGVLLGAAVLSLGASLFVWLFD